MFFQEAGGPLFEQDVLHRWFDIVGGWSVGRGAVLDLGRLQVFSAGFSG